LETGAVEGNPVTFDLKEFIEDVCDQMTPTLKKDQNIQFRHQGKANVCLDKNILNNILFNLLSNASKYSGPTPIQLSTRMSNSSLLITVKDLGIGISEEDQKHLFERFFRSKSTINLPGTGLGLNIVKKYVDLLGGQIEVRSVLGEGSTFTVKINQPEIHEKDIID
jgi:signal transduction histidine kinase